MGIDESATYRTGGLHITALDRLVLIVSGIEATCRFYTSVLGMRKMAFGDNRAALMFGQQKINLHQTGKEFEPKAATPTPGSADLCFLTDTPINEVATHMSSQHVLLLDGTVQEEHRRQRADRLRLPSGTGRQPV